MNFISILLLYLFPGVLITGVIMLASSIVTDLGLPSQMALYIPTLLVVIPIELGLLFYLGLRKNNRLSLKGIVHYLNKLTLKEYLIYIPLLTAWNFLVFVLMSPVETFLINNVFYWMSDSLLLFSQPLDDMNYSKEILLLVMTMGLVLNGIITPIIEELYFRGYLLEKTAHFRNWAPLINVVLFSLYHFFSPWKYLTIIIALLPAVFIMWKKKSLYLTILTHSILNSIGFIVGVALLF